MQHTISAKQDNSLFAQTPKFAINQCAPRAYLPDLMAERKMEAREGRENQRMSFAAVDCMPALSSALRIR